MRVFEIRKEIFMSFCFTRFGISLRGCYVRDTGTTSDGSTYIRFKDDTFIFLSEEQKNQNGASIYINDDGTICFSGFKASEDNPIAISSLNKAGARIRVENSDNFFISTSSGNDQITLDNTTGGKVVSRDGDDQITISNSTNPTVLSGDGDDQITLDNSTGVVVTSTGGNDNLFVNNSSNVFTRGFFVRH